MVTRDFYSENFSSAKKESKNEKGWDELFPAHPFDRLAAQVFDWGVVLIPILSLATSPLKKKWIENYLSENWNELLLISINYIFISFLVYSVVHVLSQFIFKTSFGKKMMGLEVINIWSFKPPTLWENYIRSLWTLAQFCLGGFPFLFVLTNQKHRGLHDQFSDTMVVSVNHQKAPLFRLWPVKLITRVGFILILSLMIPFLLKSVQLIHLDSIFSKPSESADLGCQKAEDLEEAMSLVASGYMETKCLKSYTEIEFVDGAAPSALAYLAKSFITVDEPELSDRYLKQVCKTGDKSAACSLSQFISYWSDGDQIKLETVLDDSLILNKPYLSLWALRYYQQTGQYGKSLEYSKGLTADKKFGIYVQAQILKARYFLNDQKGSDQDLNKLVSQSDSPIVLDSLAWSCLKKIEHSCDQASHPFCQQVAESNSDEVRFQTRVLLGKLRLNECAQNAFYSADYLSSGQIQSWKDLVYAFSKESKGDFKSAWSLYGDIVERSTTPDHLKAEALRRMALHPDLSEVKSLSSYIEHLDAYEYKQESAKWIAQVYQNLDLMEMAQNLRSDFNLPSDQEQKTLRRPASERGEAQ